MQKHENSIVDVNSQGLGRTRLQPLQHAFGGLRPALMLTQALEPIAVVMFCGDNSMLFGNANVQSVY